MINPTINDLIDDQIKLVGLIDEIERELERARASFPGENVTFAALIEEVGELATALFEQGRDEVRKEAVQVAVMAMRVILDGDHSFEPWRAKHDLDPLIKAAEKDAPEISVMRFMDGRELAQTLAELAPKSPPTPRRITPDMVDDEIADTVFTVSQFVDGRRITHCAVELHNGFIVTGESTCADSEGFDAELGRDLAFGKARTKIMDFLAFRLRDELSGEAA